MEFTTQHFIALAPMLITTITTVVVMLAIAWKRNHSQTFLLSTVGLNLALLSILPALKVAPLAVTPLLTIDNFACLYMAHRPGRHAGLRHPRPRLPGRRRQGLPGQP
jgi:NADH-quinone oxidoreductase subunit N